MKTQTPAAHGKAALALLSITAVTGTELRKSVRSPIFWITLSGMVFMPLMLGLLMFIKKYPELATSSLMLNKASAIPGDGDWPAYFAIFAQMISGAGLVVFGFVASWLFGREYVDRTVKDLLALPLPRGALATGKLVTMLLWCMLLFATAVATMLLIGLGLRLDNWSISYAIHCVTVYGIATLMSLGLCTLTAFIACWTRGYIAPIGFVIVTLVLANFAGMLGWGPYYPWGIPMLYAIHGTEGGPYSLVSGIIVVVMSILGGVATLVWWRHADQT